MMRLLILISIVTALSVSSSAAQAAATAKGPPPALTWNRLAPWAFPGEPYGWVSRPGDKSDPPLDAFGNPQFDADELGDDEPGPDPAEVLQGLFDNMVKSEQLLAEKKDPGEPTQTVQQNIDKGLSQLIELSKKKQQKNKKQQQQQQKQNKDSQQQQKNTKQQQRSQSKKQTKTSKPGQQAADKEEAKAGEGQDAAEMIDIEKRLEQKWGDLPGVEAHQTTQSLQEMILPKYRELLSRYFYELSRQSASSNSSGTGGR
jgi:hypothetical protein